jgi:hypothetical protein
MRRKIKSLKDDYPMPWEDRPISIERWQRHRERMMASQHAGHRPPEWWLYERQMPRPNNYEAAKLLEMGELHGEEKIELMRYWREQYERTLEPGFGYCIGRANPGDTFASWLEGPAARRAYHRWAGVPPDLVHKWDAERMRQAKMIRSLKAVSMSAGDCHAETE